MSETGPKALATDEKWQNLTKTRHFKENFCYQIRHNRPFGLPKKILTTNQMISPPPKKNAVSNQLVQNGVDCRFQPLELKTNLTRKLAGFTIKDDHFEWFQFKSIRLVGV